MSGKKFFELRNSSLEIYILRFEGIVFFSEAFHVGLQVLPLAFVRL